MIYGYFFLLRPSSCPWGVIDDQYGYDATNEFYLFSIYIKGGVYGDHFQSLTLGGWFGKGFIQFQRGRLLELMMQLFM